MRNYFCGWYFKCQSDTQTLAVIPAYHRSENGQSCSVQIITDDGAWNVCFPHEPSKKGFYIPVKGNYFGKDGIRLCLHSSDVSAVGSVRFGKLSPIRYDIMGPFCYVPFMECRHSVISMKHTVDGEICINGTSFKFQNGSGYIEGDRGYSFPKEYAWTQCCFENGSLMLSVADIPMGPFRFTGVISVIHWQGKEYRLATYLGARAVKIENGEIEIRQGDAVLTARLIEKNSHALAAPISGAMIRTIRESAACRASYCFRKNKHTLFSFETSSASFEYEYKK